MFLILCLVSSLATQSFAQTNVAEERPKIGPRKQLATIVFAGLGGAVLGLSTLSFYGRPQDRLGNIAVGFAVGIIIGTIYTTYSTAKRPPTYSSIFPEYLTNQRKNEQGAPRITADLFSYQF